MSTDGATFASGRGGTGNGYSATLLGSKLSANGYAFNLGAADGPNSDWLSPQTYAGEAVAAAPGYSKSGDGVEQPGRGAGRHPEGSFAEAFTLAVLGEAPPA
jgi:hypothetical protein